MTMKTQEMKFELTEKVPEYAREGMQAVMESPYFKHVRDYWLELGFIREKPPLRVYALKVSLGNILKFETSFVIREIHCTARFKHEQFAIHFMSDGHLLYLRLHNGSVYYFNEGDGDIAYDMVNEDHLTMRRPDKFGRPELVTDHKYEIIEL